MPAPAPAAAAEAAGPVGHAKRSSRSSSSSSRIDPKKLPSEISVLEIRVGLVRKVRGETGCAGWIEALCVYDIFFLGRGEGNHVLLVKRLKL